MRLLGQLAQRGYLFSAEVAATQSLTLLLDDPAICRGFASLLKDTFGSLPTERLRWQSEVIVPGVGRLDIAGVHNDLFRVVIEAKIDAPAQREQFASYLSWLEAAPTVNKDVVFIVLVLAVRLESALSELNRVPRTHVRTAVLTWESVVASLTKHLSPDDPRVGDVAQLESILHAALGWNLQAPRLHVQPVWPTLNVTYADALIYAVTASIPGADAVFPMQRNKAEAITGRYYARNHAAPNLMLLLPKSPRPESPATSLWIRFHRTTYDFLNARQRLLHSDMTVYEDADTGHLWIPVHLDHDQSGVNLLHQVQLQVIAADRLACGDTL